MYLVDTDVFSELRRSRRNRNVVAWFGDVNAADLFLSVVTIGEIEFGLSRQQTPIPVFAQHPADWLNLPWRAYGERILPLTVGIARRWGRLAAQLGKKELELAIDATEPETGLLAVNGNES